MKTHESWRNGMKDKCIQCGKKVKDKPGKTKVIYVVRLEEGGDGFLCDENCENQRRISEKSP